MIMFNANEKSKCVEFSVHYYDYLFEGKDLIPAEALEHFSSCQNCKAEMKSLKTELEPSSDTEGKQALSAVRAASIKLHFAYINKLVGCNEARQFFVTMMSGKAIQTPTPITVHVSNCPSCLADYYTLKRIDLPEKNLYKIGQLMADKSISSLSEVEIGVKIFQALGGIKCDKTTIDELVEIVCRPASGVKTLFNLKDEVTREDISICDEDQIDVSVFNNNRTPQAKPEPKSKRASANFNLSKYLMPIAAAAVLIVAFMLFKGPTATADYDQIYKTLAGINNVHIKKTNAVTEDVFHEIWISQELNIMVNKYPNKISLCDMDKELRIIKNMNNNTVETEKIDDDRFTLISRRMQAPWSLLPFNAVSDLPKGATWKVIKETNGIEQQQGTERYELMWTKKSIVGNKEFGIKWIGLVDPKTFLLKRIEWWEKKNSEDDYTLITVTEVDFPGTEQIKEIVGSFEVK